MPGHTSQDISLVMRTMEQGVVAVAGDVSIVPGHGAAFATSGYLRRRVGLAETTRTLA